MIDGYLGSREAAALLGIHPKTLERHARNGSVPGYRKFRRWYFDKKELDAYIRDEVDSEGHPSATNGGLVN